MTRINMTIAEQLEAEIRPLIDKDKWDGGYNCCGCATYNAILDHAIRIVQSRERLALTAGEQGASTVVPTGDDTVLRQ